MAACFKGQIQTLADITPMCCEALSLPHWSLVKGDRDSKVSVGATRLGGCRTVLTPTQVWSRVASPDNESIRNAIAYL